MSWKHFLRYLSLDRIRRRGQHFRGLVTLQIVALLFISVLLLFPAVRMLRALRRAKRTGDPLLSEGPRQLMEQILVLVLVLAALAVGVLMHFAPF